MNNQIVSPNNSKGIIVPAKKTLHKLSITVGYCKHTSTKLAVGTAFHNSPTAAKNSLVASEHPIFALPLRTIYTIYSECTMASERYIAMVAYLVNLGVISTRDTAINLDAAASSKLEDCFEALVRATRNLLDNSKLRSKLSIPTLVVSDTSASDCKVLRSHIKHCVDMVEATRINQYATCIEQEFYTSNIPLSDIEKLYASADDERDLVTMLAQYTNKKREAKYSKHLGAWAIKQIKANTDYNHDTIELIRKVIFQDCDKVPADTMRHLIKLVKEGLTYEDYERENSLLVIRMLESKLELILDVAYSFGFIGLEQETSSNLKGQVSYDTRTKVARPTALATITTRKAVGTSALDRLRNKFKVAP